MSTAIIVAVLIVIAVIAIRSYAKKLTSGCCGGENEHVKKIKVEDKDVSHYPYCVQIGIDGMNCNHCKARVENTLNSEDGVWAEVDLSQNLATVHMKNNLSELFLRKLVSSAGYIMTTYNVQ